eukprot:112738-Pyramimonas_sp.AAC.1
MHARYYRTRFLAVGAALAPVLVVGAPADPPARLPRPLPASPPLATWWFSDHTPVVPGTPKTRTRN